MTAHWERIQALDGLEKDIITCIQSAGNSSMQILLINVISDMKCVRFFNFQKSFQLLSVYVR